VSPREKELLHNPRFLGSLYFRRAAPLKARDLFDNVYTEVRPRHYFIRTTGPNASTQTHILDFLQGVQPDVSTTTKSSPKRVYFSSASSSEEEDGFAQVYAQQMINDVVGNISDTTPNYFASHKPSVTLGSLRMGQIPDFNI